jgi:hypothetical protein
MNKVELVKENFKEFSEDVLDMFARVSLLIIKRRKSENFRMLAESAVIALSKNSKELSEKVPILKETFLSFPQLSDAEVSELEKYFRSISKNTEDSLESYLSEKLGAVPSEYLSGTITSLLGENFLGGIYDLRTETSLVLAIVSGNAVPLRSDFQLRPKKEISDLEIKNAVIEYYKKLGCSIKSERISMGQSFSVKKDENLIASVFITNGGPGFPILVSVSNY